MSTKCVPSPIRDLRFIWKIVPRPVTRKTAIALLRRPLLPSTFRPKGVATCADRVFVTDSYLGSVQVFDLSGSFLGVLANADGIPMKLVTPTGITSDPERKRLYVVELKANRVCRVDLE